MQPRPIIGQTLAIFLMCDKSEVRSWDLPSSNVLAVTPSVQASPSTFSSFYNEREIPPHQGGGLSGGFVSVGTYPWDPPKFTL